MMAVQTVFLVGLTPHVFERTLTAFVRTLFMAVQTLFAAVQTPRCGCADTFCRCATPLFFADVHINDRNQIKYAVQKIFLLLESLFDVWEMRIMINKVLNHASHHRDGLKSRLKYH